MPIRPKQPDPPPPTRTQERARDHAESQSAITSLQDRIMNWPNPPPDKEESDDDPSIISSEDIPPPPARKPGDATPVGGRKEEPKPPKPPEAVVGAEPVPEDQLESEEQLEQTLGQIQPRSENERKPISVIKEAAKKQNRLAHQYKTKLGQLEKDLKDLQAKVLPEEEVGRLRDMEKIVASERVELLPRFKQYDQEIAQIGSQATELLKGFTNDQNQPVVDDKVMGIIEKRGGVLKFSESDKPAGVKKADGSASDMTEKQWFQKFVYDRLSRRQQTQLDILTTDAITKQKEKDVELEKARSNATEELKKAGKEQADSFIQQAAAAVEELRTKELPDFGFPIKKPEIMTADSPEVKKQKETQIAIWDKVEAAMNAQVNKPKQIGEIRFKAAMYDAIKDSYLDVKKQLEAEKKRADDLDAKWRSIKDARRLGRQPQAPGSGAAAQDKEYNEMSTEEALAARGFK